jgi:hypothetical protein
VADSGSDRQVTVRPGRHTGWWVEGRRRSRLFMKTWWPTEGMARMVGRWVGRPPKDDAKGDTRNGAAERRTGDDDGPDPEESAG